jgi:hypothetical protein
MKDHGTAKILPEEWDAVLTVLEDTQDRLDRGLSKLSAQLVLLGIQLDEITVALKKGKK